MFAGSEKSRTFASLLKNKRHRAFSSAGSEHLPYKQRVGGSNPSTPTEILKITRKGRLAQLVHSICLTRRGSAVRIRHRPLNIVVWSSLKLDGLITQRSSVRVRPPQLERRSICFSFFLYLFVEKLQNYSLFLV